MSKSKRRTKLPKDVQSRIVTGNDRSMGVSVVQPLPLEKRLKPEGSGDGGIAWQHCLSQRISPPQPQMSPSAEARGAVTKMKRIVNCVLFVMVRSAYGLFFLHACYC